MKKLFLKSNQLSNINNSLYLNQETLKPDTNQNIIEKSDLNNNNNSFLQNKNNITIDYPKNYPHAFTKSPLELPKIQNQKKTINVNNTKMSGIKRIMISNSSTNVYSQNLFGLQSNKKVLKKDKTQINILNENVNLNNNNNISNDDINYKSNNIIKDSNDISLFKRKLKSPNNINNITNINIHIYSNKNKENGETIQRNTGNANENKMKNINITSRDIINKPLNNIQLNNAFNRNNSTIETQ